MEENQEERIEVMVFMFTRVNGSAMGVNYSERNIFRGVDRAAALCYKATMAQETIASLVRATRGSRTMREFAGLVGCSVPSIHKWENGAIPDTKWLVRLAELTGRPVGDVIALSLQAA